ncbi:DUF881 domain-containing protein [Kitasatospora sp. NPDC048286]|uniref:DUF881 domain-containing protein n=1 Tax=Kitasatospora sp. NPDC048286 TaxID=3364047 RepID=UPI00371140E0
MSSAPEPGRGAAEEKREAVAVEPTAGKPREESGEKPVEQAANGPEPEPDARSGAAGAAEASGAVETAGEAAESEESGEASEGKPDAEAEPDAGTGPEPTLRLTKPAEPAPEAEPDAESVAEPAAKSAPAPVPVAEPEHKPEASPEPEPEAEPDPAADRNAGRRRLKAAIWPPRLSRGQLVVALLLFSLGLGLAIQVRSTNDHHSQLRGARQEDLVRILDELDSRQQRLQQEKAELEQSLAKLENSSNQAKEAQEQTRKKMTELGVLAGTAKATGPGIVLTVDDPQGQVKADMLLDTLQELRAAGAEAIQINDVRVVVNTYFTDLSAGGVQIDGKKVSQPYRFTVVGNPQDLTPALNIPGGVVRTLESHQARATIAPQQKVVVDALVDPKSPQYAKPASK